MQTPRDLLEQLPSSIGPHARLALLTLHAAPKTPGGRVQHHDQQAARMAAGLSHRQWAEALMRLSLAGLIDRTAGRFAVPADIPERAADPQIEEV